ncbi:hypothetical protein [Flavobacterium sp. W20_MBD1_R3]|uniref:hypothetical protein n=1 Tax=Flavobacterium sp. W20_MBD1_R3 TaxID=3240278 RepID=UPI003F8EBE12
MKSKINSLLFVIVLLNVFFVKAQVLQTNAASDLYNLVDKSMISNLNFGSTVQSQAVDNFIISNNLIQVQQVGFNNYSTVTVKSENYEIGVNQNGFNNYLNLYKNTGDLNETISQSGANNFVSDFSLYSNSAINMSINQEGNNLSLFNNGTNSISKDLKITQTGNSGSIYIFNH